MFALNKHRAWQNDFPLIESNYQILLSDEGEPILYSGTNSLGNWIIGSAVSDDDVLGTQRFFHVAVQSKTYADFLNQRITYREILENTQDIFVIDKLDTRSVQQIHVLPFAKIPKSYLPGSKSFCPEQAPISATDYVAKLEGGNADAHLANPADVGEVQVPWGQFLVLPFKNMFPEFGKTYALMSPPTTGSFELHYGLRFTNEQLDLFGNHIEECKLFAQHFMRYCLNDLPEELPNVPRDNHDAHVTDGSPKLIRLLSLLDDVVRRKDGTNAMLVKATVEASQLLNAISQAVGPSFKQIALSSRIKGRIGHDFVLGVVDHKFGAQISDAIQVYEQKTRDVHVDPEPQDYEILIYHLNTSTRMGNAQIANDKSQKKWDRPVISIDEKAGPLESSPYTESLHENKMIKVRGVARKVDGKFRGITVLGYVESTD